MNITHGTLFPDYAGAVEICITDLGLDINEVYSIKPCFIFTKFQTFILLGWGQWTKLIA